MLSLVPEFAEKFGEEGYYERAGEDRFAFRYNVFAYGNKMKFDLFQKYGALAAAGDRHIAEFLPGNWYLKDPETVKKWQFCLTSVDFREKDQAEKIADTIAMAEGRKEFPVKKSDEEAVAMLKALLGFGTLVTNVNMPNRGQMPQMPMGAIVETNCVFSNDMVSPVVSKPLPTGVKSLVSRCSTNIDMTYEGIKERDLNKIFQAFVDQPLCNCLTIENAKKLFREMCLNTREYLDPYFDLDTFFQ